MQAYGRDPRSIAKRGEAYLKSTGVADTAFFGPEPEFFVFDSVRWQNDMGRVFYEIGSEEAALELVATSTTATTPATVRA